MNRNNFHVEDISSGGGVIVNDIEDSFEYEMEKEAVLEWLDAYEVSKEEFIGKDDIEEKLFDFIEKENIKLLISDKSRCEAFFSTGHGYSGIVLKSKMFEVEDNTMRLVTLAHELGHYMDFKWNFQFDSHSFVKASKEGKELFSEITAWVYAEEMLQYLGFDKWMEFDDIKFGSLLTYACYDIEGLEEYLGLEYFIVMRRENNVIEKDAVIIKEETE